MGRYLMIALILQPLLIALVAAFVVVSPLVFLGWLITFFFSHRKVNKAKSIEEKFVACATKRNFEKMISQFGSN